NGSARTACRPSRRPPASRSGSARPLARTSPRILERHTTAASTAPAASAAARTEKARPPLMLELAVAVLLAPPPRPAAPIPHAPAVLATTLSETTSALGLAIQAWVTKANDRSKGVVLCEL